MAFSFGRMGVSVTSVVSVTRANTRAINVEVGAVLVVEFCCWYQRA